MGVTHQGKTLGWELASLGEGSQPWHGDLLYHSQLGPLAPGISLILPTPCNLEVDTLTLHRASANHQNGLCSLL